jgi:hypothetical protein
MEEARRVLERLDRIETLRHASPAPAVLLDEVRALLGEAEEWVRTDPAGAHAEGALERVREALETGAKAGSGQQRTLVA